MRNEQFDEAVNRILAFDTRYPAQAYVTISNALAYTLRALTMRDGHVSGRQLSEGFRDYILNEYGPFSRSILNKLNLHETDDLGNLVYNLIRVGAFGKTDQDRREDFHAVYSFEQAFDEPFQILNP